MPNPAIDISNQRFGRLIAIHRTPRQLQKASTAAEWHCQCDCGKTTVVRGDLLRAGRVRSCGCLHSDETRNRLTRHGAARKNRRTPEYQTWQRIFQRCYNPNTVQFKDYGGRGIEVRYEIFEKFLADVGLRPSPQHSIDRIDNDGHYEPGNCRWATAKEQRANQRRKP